MHKALTVRTRQCVAQVLLNAGVVGLTLATSWLFASYAPEGPGASDNDRHRRLRSSSISEE
jgi:hypothetical protein